MSDDRPFVVEQYDEIMVLTLTIPVATRELHDGALLGELQAIFLTAQPLCIVVSFARLQKCPSSLIACLIALRRKLTLRRIELSLCEMNTQLRDQFKRLHLDRVFEIRESVADAVASCEEAITSEKRNV